MTSELSIYFILIVKRAADVAPCPPDAPGNVILTACVLHPVITVEESSGKGAGDWQMREVVRQEAPWEQSKGVDTTLFHAWLRNGCERSRGILRWVNYHIGWDCRKVWCIHVMAFGSVYYLFLNLRVKFPISLLFEDRNTKKDKYLTLSGTQC